tara:strand:- start:2747 stop:3496 length:750 start_codon:yes stop_codon:yes gene_type:complete
MNINQKTLKIAEKYVRPICFCENKDSWVWGRGSSFLINYLGHVFAITAKHVIENQNANPLHTNISMQNTNVMLPIKLSFTPTFTKHENKSDVEDLLFFNIDDQLFLQKSDINLCSWDVLNNSYLASKLSIGDELIVTGFPHTPTTYDYDKKIITNTLLIRTASLIKSELGCNIYTMKGTSSEFNFDGMSGSPVFCQKDGALLFLGIVIRGSSKSGILHFIGFEVIISILEKSGIQQNKPIISSMFITKS